MNQALERSFGMRPALSRRALEAESKKFGQVRSPAELRAAEQRYAGMKNRVENVPAKITKNAALKVLGAKRTADVEAMANRLRRDINDLRAADEISYEQWYGAHNNVNVAISIATGQRFDYPVDVWRAEQRAQKASSSGRRPQSSDDTNPVVGPAPAAEAPAN
jgi:hypothetical protein